jgi:hypothetical protein
MGSMAPHGRARCHSLDVRRINAVPSRAASRFWRASWCRAGWATSRALQVSEMHQGSQHACQQGAIWPHAWQCRPQLYSTCVAACRVCCVGAQTLQCSTHAFVLAVQHAQNSRGMQSCHASTACVRATEVQALLTLQKSADQARAGARAVKRHTRCVLCTHTTHTGRQRSPSCGQAHTEHCVKLRAPGSQSVACGQACATATRGI